MLVSSSVSWLHSEMNEVTRSCSSRSSNDLFMTSSASSMLLDIWMKSEWNIKQSNWVVHQTWSRWFCSISFCHATQPHPFASVSTTCDVLFFWNSFDYQHLWTKCQRIDRPWWRLWFGSRNWISSVMKCFDATALSPSTSDSVEESLGEDYAILAFDWSRCRYHSTHQSAVVNLTINVIRNCSTFAWMEPRKLNSTVDIKVELNRRQDVPLWFKMFSQFIVYLWTRCRHDLCSGYHREWIIFETGRSKWKIRKKASAEVNHRLRRPTIQFYSVQLSSLPRRSLQCAIKYQLKATYRR